MMRPLWPLLLIACGLCLSPMLSAQESPKPARGDFEFEVNTRIAA
jgi:hypothetical protein